MIVLTKPYVSDVLASTMRKLQLPVVKVDDVALANEQELNLLSEQDFIHYFQQHDTPSILCNSEASLQYVCNRLHNHPIAEAVNLFKNKAEFRRFMAADYPDYDYRVVRASEWESIDPASLPYPVIVKPAVGYSSIGVYRVEHAGQWHEVMRCVQAVLSRAARMYTSDVINSDVLIIEKWIDGEEYAIDAYFDAEGEPVILNVFARMFANDSDTSDRIYCTNKFMLREMLGPLSEFLAGIGRRLQLRNFPLHAEVRRTKAGHIVPVEINPLRFAGIGTNELGIHAYGINPSEYFFLNMKPDWGNKLQEMDDSVYSFFCAEYDLNGYQSIRGFDHEGLKKCFQNVLEYRLMPAEYNTFAVVFYKSVTFLENHRLLHMNLAPYILSGQIGLAN